MIIFDAASKTSMESGRSVASINKGGCEMKRDQRTKNRHTSHWVVAMVVLSIAAPAIAWGPPPPLVSMNVVDANPWVVPLQPGYAWPITLTMTVRERDILGIGVSEGVGWFPPAAGPGFLVFEDPDSCPSFIPFTFYGQELAYLTHYCPGQGSYDLVYPGCTPPDWRPYLDYDCPSDVPSGLDWFTETEAIEAGDPGRLKWFKDETWLQFGPGISVVSGGALSDPNREIGSQEVWTWDGVQWKAAYAGPHLGSIYDGIGFGRSSKLPGLVVLADHGPGLLTTPLGDPPPNPDPNNIPTDSSWFDRPAQEAAWNLAGFVNSVGYTLLNNDRAPVAWGRIRLQAPFNVPTGLITPVVMVDKNVDNPFTIDGELCGDDPSEAPYRMDGGPLQCAENLGAYYSVDPIVNEVVVTVRVFVVDGDAPEVVSDFNGDGIVDIDDVEAIGYVPLSAQRTFSFRQFHQIKCESYQGYDFDGNGQAGGCVLGARAGGITGVPR